MKMMLCGRSGGCCPIVEQDGDEFTITDDYGGVVRLTKKEMEVLRGAEFEGAFQL